MLGRALSAQVRWRALLLAASVVFAVAAAALIVPRTAQSAGADSSCTYTTHCYGIDQWAFPNAPSNTGNISTINVSQLSVFNQCTGFDTAEMWEDGYNTARWTEMGVLHGEHNDGTCGNGDQWFWADMDPNDNFHEHFPGGSFGLNTSYTLRIQWNGVNSWVFYRNGSQIGSTSDLLCCSEGMSAGTEIAESVATTQGTSNGLQKDTGSWSYGWGGNLVQGHGATASWATTGTNLNWAYSG